MALFLKKRKIFFSVIFCLILGSTLLPSRASISSEDANPVILVPGITASWNWDEMLGGNFGSSWGWFPGVRVYDTLIQTLENEGFDVFVCFYDWRKSNRQSAADFLRSKINQVKSITGKDKVDIVAHSMGGLVARAYIQSNVFYQNDVERLVMLGVSNHGSSDAYSPWEGGVIPKNWGGGYKLALDAYLWYARHFMYEESSNYDLIHSHIPSLGELMPTYQYLYRISASGATSSVHYMLMEEQNDFLKELNDSSRSPNLFSLVYVSNLAGSSQATVGDIYVLPPKQGSNIWKDGKPNPFPPPRNTEDGDNRVLEKSVFFGNLQVLYPIWCHIDPSPGPEEFWQIGNERSGTFLDTAHTVLPHRAIEEVIYWLREPAIFPIPSSFCPDYRGPAAQLPDVQIPEPIQEPDEELAFFFTDNLEIEIVDPKGRKISQTENEIPGAEFNAPPNPKGPKIIYFPNPEQGEYSVKLKGLEDDQTVDFAAYYSSNNASEFLDFSDEILEGEEKEYDVSFDSDNGENFLDSELVYDLDDLIQETKLLYQNGALNLLANCDFLGLDYQLISQARLEEIKDLKLGKLEAGEGACLKIDAFFETDDNAFQGQGVVYEILLKAGQLNDENF